MNPLVLIVQIEAWDGSLFLFLVVLFLMFVAPTSVQLPVPRKIHQYFLTLSPSLEMPEIL